MRLFIGIRIPENVAHRLSDLWSSLSDRPGDLRMVDPASWHLNLAFLGDVREEQFEALNPLIATALERPPQGSFSFVGFETFPPKGPCLVAAKLDEEDAKRWKPFVERLRDIVSLAAPQMDRKPWIPHMTIGRSRKNTQCIPWAFTFDLITWKPTELALIKSEPGPTGSVYTDLHVYPLDV
jgi:2'-5' RNA ligase